MAAQNFIDAPPDGDLLTDYDRAHVVLYLRLLDSIADGADWREAVGILFHIDPVQESERARKVYDNHLARARWMTSNGYKHLLRGSLN